MVTKRPCLHGADGSSSTSPRSLIGQSDARPLRLQLLQTAQTASGKQPHAAAGSWLHKDAICWVIRDIAYPTSCMSGRMQLQGPVDGHCMTKYYVHCMVLFFFSSFLSEFFCSVPPDRTRFQPPGSGSKKVGTNNQGSRASAKRLGRSESALGALPHRSSSPRSRQKIFLEIRTPREKLLHFSSICVFLYHTYPTLVKNLLRTPTPTWH